MSGSLKWTLFSTILFLSVLALYLIWTGDFSAGVMKTVSSFAILTGGAFGLSRIGGPRG